jgi:protein-disulfide isomerase
MRFLRLAAVVRLVWLAGLAVASGCTGGKGPGDASAQMGDVDLPGVDTHDLTPREKHEFSRYVAQFPAPCRAVAVSLATCVIEKRACAACVPGAAAVAKAVREGMAAEQVEAMYKQRFDASGVRAIPVDGSPSRGPESAPVTIVEFADFECPFCQRIAPKLDELWEKRQTNIRFVYKFMPLTMHPHSEIAARAAIAAQAQGKFWPMHHALFTNGSHLEAGDLEGYAKGLGLDMDRFRADAQSSATTARLEADRKLADDLGVKGTPTIYVNGREFDVQSDLPGWVDGEIAQAKQSGAVQPAQTRQTGQPGQTGNELK